MALRARLPLSDRERMRVAARLPSWLPAARSALGERLKVFRLASRAWTRSLERLPLDVRPRVSADEFEATLERFVARCRDAGIGVMLLSVPRRAVVERQTPAVLAYTQRMHGVAERLDVPLVDARAAFRAQGDDEASWFIDSVHVNGEANAVRAGLLAPAVLAAAPPRPSRSARVTGPRP